MRAELRAAHRRTSARSSSRERRPARARHARPHRRHRRRRGAEGAERQRQIVDVPGGDRDAALVWPRARRREGRDEAVGGAAANAARPPASPPRAPRAPRAPPRATPATRRHPPPLTAPSATASGACAARGGRDAGPQRVGLGGVRSADDTAAAPTAPVLSATPPPPPRRRRALPMSSPPTAARLGEQASPKAAEALDARSEHSGRATLDGDHRRRRRRRRRRGRRGGGDAGPRGARRLGVEHGVARQHSVDSVLSVVTEDAHSPTRPGVAAAYRPTRRAAR